MQLGFNVCVAVTQSVRNILSPLDFEPVYSWPGVSHPILKDPRWRDMKAAKAATSYGSWTTKAYKNAEDASGGDTAIAKAAYAIAAATWRAANKK